MRREFKGNSRVTAAKKHKIENEIPPVEKNRIVDGKAKREKAAPVYLRRAYRTQ